jgi:hypothetical protein
MSMEGSPKGSCLRHDVGFAHPTVAEGHPSDSCAAVNILIQLDVPAARACDVHATGTCEALDTIVFIETYVSWRSLISDNACISVKAHVHAPESRLSIDTSGAVSFAVIYQCKISHATHMLQQPQQTH